MQDVAREVNLNNLKNSLKNLRSTEKQASEQLATAQSELEQTEAYQIMLQCKVYLEVVKDDLKETDGAIRAQAITQYHETGNQKPVEGVSIAIGKECIYKVDEAKEWAWNNERSMLNLVVLKFEKHAKAVVDTSPLDFVKIEEKPSVRISKEL